jgi:hypothetical protein
MNEYKYWKSVAYRIQILYDMIRISISGKVGLTRKLVRQWEVSTTTCSAPHVTLGLATPMQVKIFPL